MVRVLLFVYLHNAGRSQISQAPFERAAAGRHTADSAGSVADPNGCVHPESSLCREALTGSAH